MRYLTLDWVLERKIAIKDMIGSTYRTGMRVTDRLEYCTRVKLIELDRAERRRRGEIRSLFLKMPR